MTEFTIGLAFGFILGGAVGSLGLTMVLLTLWRNDTEESADA